MATNLTVWCLLIDHEKNLIGNPFQVDVEHTTDVADLKEKVKSKATPRLDNLDAFQLDVWRCKGLLVDEEEEKTGEPIRAMDISKGSKCRVAQKVLELSLDIDKEMLLVQIPGVLFHGLETPLSLIRWQLFSRDPRRLYNSACSPPLHEDCQTFVIRLASRSFDRDDILQQNNITVELMGESGFDDCPHLEQYLHRLDTPRKIANDIKNKDAFSFLMNDNYEDISSDDDAALPFSESETCHMWLVALKDMNGGNELNWTSYSSPHEVGFGEALWGLKLPVNIENAILQYEPMSDFFLSLHGIPSLIVEVDRTALMTIWPICLFKGQAWFGLSTD